MKELVSIIILNYNRNNDNSITIECLKSLENQIYSNFEIILVDNGSDHKYFLELKKDITQFKKSLSIHLIRIERNLFFVSANNKAIKKANGEIICLLNNDTEVMPDFLEKMLHFLKNHPEAGLICPKIKVYKNKAYLWYAGAEVNFKERKLIHIRGQWEIDPQNIKYCEVKKTDFAAGTAVFLKKEIIKKIGLMDEVFLFYNEDPDWNIRAQKAGYESFYVPSTIVYHKVMKRMAKKRVLLNNYFYTRNSQILVWKHAKLIEFLIFYRKFITENIKEILTALDTAKDIKGKPTVIVAHTMKGKGVSFMEGAVGFHGKAPDDEECKQALDELGGETNA